MLEQNTALSVAHQEQQGVARCTRNELGSPCILPIYETASLPRGHKTAGEGMCACRVCYRFKVWYRFKVDTKFVFVLVEHSSQQQHP